MDLAIQAGGAALGYPGLGRLAGTAYRAYKRRRTEAGPSTPGTDMMDGGSNPSGFGGVYHGRFSGPVKRSSKSGRIFHGFKEKVIFSGRSSQKKCWYMNVHACPVPANPDNILTAGDPGAGVDSHYVSRALIDICIAIVREFYKKYHPGRIEFTSPDDKVSNYLGSLGISNGAANQYLPREHLCYVYTNADGSGTSNVELVVFVRTGTDGNGNPTYSADKTLRNLGNELAVNMWNKWKEGSIPYCLVSAANNADGIQSTRGSMMLNQLVVEACVYNKVFLQNVTKGEGNENSITNIDMDPLVGKMFYHKGLLPSTVVGTQLGLPAGAADEWFQDYMSYPTMLNPSTPAEDVLASSLRNLTFPVNQVGAGTANPNDPIVVTVKDPTGCWVTLPKHEYFKRCNAVRDIRLEPGVMRSFNLDFNFVGYLTTFMSRLQNEYAVNIAQPWNTANLGYKFPFGSCVTIALEKRMRYDPGDDVPIQLAFQIETVITADIKKKQQGMTYHVETNY